MKQLITIPKHWNVLVVEDAQSRIEWFSDRLGPGPMDFATTPQMAFDYLYYQTYDMVFLDHDAGASDDEGPITFMPVAQKLREMNYQGTVMIHSMNPYATKRMQSLIPGSIIAAFGNFDLKRQS